MIPFFLVPALQPFAGGANTANAGVAKHLDALPATQQSKAKQHDMLAPFYFPVISAPTTSTNPT